MEPVLSGAALKAAEVGVKAASAAADETGSMLSRLFGPSADVIGQNWAERLRERNLARLLKKTEAHDPSSEGFANPRVASQVFESAEYSDSEVVAEYLSGVLASSRDGSGTDDAGVAWSSVVARLSSDQLRLHYVIYASLRVAVISDPPARSNELHGKPVAMGLAELLSAAGFSTFEAFADALDGLMREGLIDTGYRYGNVLFVFERELKKDDVVFPFENAIRLSLSIHGLRLFLWGCGAGRFDSDVYVDPKRELNPAEPDTMPPLVGAANLVSQLISPRPAAQA